MARRKKVLVLALILFTLPAMSCPHEDMDTPTGSIIDELEPREEPRPEEQEPAGNLSGRVLINGEAAEGITMTLTSESLSSPETDTTGDLGYYFFSELAAGPHTVTITGFPPDVQFDTLSQVVDIEVGRDFEGDAAPNSAPPFRGFRGTKVDVLVFGDNAYPTARFVEVGVEPGCDAAHWHSHERVPLLATRSESGAGFDCAAIKQFFKSDPAPGQCGHGKVKEVRRQDIFVPAECLEDYIKIWGPLAP